MSENLKLRTENTAIETPHERLTRTPDVAAGSDIGPIDEAETQMRRALGLLGEGQHHRPDQDRPDQSQRSVDRIGNGLHRRRFVQDGDIPVTVLRRDQGHEAQVSRGAVLTPPPTSSRLQRTEAALAAETAAREKAERALADVQAVAHDLQTKIGHAELARNEAVEALRREREVIVQLRADSLGWEERLEEALAKARAAEQAVAACQVQLADERHARKDAEKALRSAESARDGAEQIVRALSDETATARRKDSRPRPRAEPEVAAAAASRRLRMPDMQTAEPEPVKWWLNAKPGAKRRS